MTNVVFVVVAFICAFLLAYSSTPGVRVLAFRIGAVDVPLDERRIHKKPIPRIGGLAIYLSFLVTSALFCRIDRGLVTIWVGGAMLVIIGILDDIYRLRPWIKLLVQLAAAGFAVWNGCVIDHINLGGEYVFLGVFSIPLTILWITGLTNAINFIDGLDGLACGVSAISSFSFLLVVLLNGDLASTLLCVILFASCLGFLPFNSNPARIFMGDTGALFLGYALAVISVLGVFKLHAVLSFLVPILILALPIFDTLFAIIRRLAHGKSPFEADRGHLHHRLIDMGFTQKESVRILYAIAGIMGLVAVFCTNAMFDSARARTIKTIAIALIAVALFLVNYGIMIHPSTRKHTGITEDDMSVSEYMSELDAAKAKKIEAHNAESAEHGKTSSSDKPGDKT